MSSSAPTPMCSGSGFATTGAATPTPPAAPASSASWTGWKRSAAAARWTARPAPAPPWKSHFPCCQRDPVVGCAGAECLGGRHAPPPTTEEEVGGALLAPGDDESGELVRRDGPAEQVALHLVAAPLGQVGQLVGGFDALGDHLETEAVAEGDHGRDDGVGAAGELGDEGPVDLETVNGETVQIAEPAVAGAEVVDGTRHPEGSQLLELVDGELQAVE